MRAPDGYTLQKLLRSNADREVYLATRADGTEVVLKAYLADRGPDAEQLLRHEFEVLRKVAGPGVPVAIQLVTESSTPVLVLERAPGVSLLGWIETNRPSIPTFLEIAIQLTEVLMRVHSAHVILRDLGPDKIMIDPGTGRTHVVDFALAQPLGADSRRLNPLSWGQQIAGSLHFIAPEQTGRMNRGIDTRSDLYGLGAALYFTLTQRTLFDISDPLSLVHAHMARVPRAPIDVRPDVPPALSRILLKLVEKEPEARYQTASALLADLRCCSDQLANRGRIDEALVLGMAEAPDRPRFSGKLHGRDAQIALLSSLYAKAAGGSVQTLMLAGEPGETQARLALALARFAAERARRSQVVADFPSLRSGDAGRPVDATIVEDVIAAFDAEMASALSRLDSGVRDTLLHWYPDLAGSSTLGS